MKMQTYAIAVENGKNMETNTIKHKQYRWLIPSQASLQKLHSCLNWKLKENRPCQRRVFSEVVFISISVSVIQFSWLLLFTF